MDLEVSQPVIDADAQSAEKTFATILRLFRVVQANLQTMEQASGLSGSQLWALWQISATPGLKVTGLAEALRVHPSTASNLVDRLQNRGLVQRNRDTTDTRVVHLALTAEGCKKVEQMPGPLQGHLRDALHRLPKDQLHSLHDAVTSLLKDMPGAMLTEKISLPADSGVE